MENDFLSFSKEAEIIKAINSEKILYILILLNLIKKIMIIIFKYNSKLFIIYLENFSSEVRIIKFNFGFVIEDDFLFFSGCLR